MGLTFSLDVSKAYRTSGYDEIPSQDEIEEAILDAAEEGVKVAQDNARVDTGFMRDSVDYYIDGTTLHFECDVDYAEYNEYGTYKMDAQPFMEPGLDAIISTLNDRLGLSE